MPPVLSRIRKLLTAPEPKMARRDELQIAVAVLLVEAARMDDEFSAAERAAIEHLLAGKFHLSADETRRLLIEAEAKAKESHQLHPFTRLAVERMPREKRLRLLEMLWEVAYSDGTLDADEDHLLRRIAGLIYVSDEDRVAARQRVLQRMGRRNTQ